MVIVFACGVLWCLVVMVAYLFGFGWLGAFLVCVVGGLLVAIWA